MIRRLVSRDFIVATEEKLEYGRKQGRTGWDSNWEKISIDSFGIINLLDKLIEETVELTKEVHPVLSHPTNLALVRLEAADVANVAMMIADMAGALVEDEGLDDEGWPEEADDRLVIR